MKKHLLKLCLTNIIYFGINIIFSIIKFLPTDYTYIDLNGYLFILTLPVYLILYSVFSCKLTNKIIIPQIILGLFMIPSYFTVLWFCNDRPIEMLPSLITNYITRCPNLMILPIIVALITKLIIIIIAKKNKNKNSAD